MALLLPLAGALGVSVTELLEGRRAVQEQRYSAAEVEALIRRALAFPVEPPERQQARVKRYLPVYLICCVLGVAEALAVCAAGLPGLVHGIHAAAATLSGGGGAAGPALGRQGDRCSICSVHPEPVRMHRRARQAA